MNPVLGIVVEWLRRHPEDVTATELDLEYEIHPPQTTLRRRR